MRQYITAGGAGDEVPSQSTFTPVFVDALKYQLGDLNKDGYITGTELGMYLETRVPQSIRQIPQYGKIRDYDLSRGDFIFVAKKQLPTPRVQYAYLTVDTYPSNARVRILNIEPVYYPGIKLKPGAYHIEVAETGYKTRKQWLEIPLGNISHKIELDKAGIQPDMVDIEGDCYQMGSPEWETDRDTDERRHKVCVNGFQMGKKEVTVGEFRKFVRATGYRTQAEKNVEQQGCYAYSSSEKKWAYRAGHNWGKVGFSQNDQHPVVCVSWMDVQSYIDWLNENSIGGYRLPTEAEWEYAARDGTQTAYSWGSEVDSKACLYANNNDKNWAGGFPCDYGYKYTAPVGNYRVNDFGLYDMTGNVWEWTCSKYDKKYTGGEKKCISKNRANNDDVFVSRGGAFDDVPRSARVAYRGWGLAWGRGDDEGFRLARTR